MKTFTATLHNQKRTLTVMTAYRAKRLGLNPSRSYGYVIRVEPPISFTTEGQDVEGIGWCPHPPRQHHQHFLGWYKYRCFAESRAYEFSV